jgi:hypothetical protein
MISTHTSGTARLAADALARFANTILEAQIS